MNEQNQTKSLTDILQRQKRAFERARYPALNVRKNRLSRVIALLVDNQCVLCDAMDADFSGRSTHQSRMADIYGAVEPLKYALKHVGRWMKDEPRKVQAPLNLLGAKARVKYQPKGVVGAISTWNFPVWVPMSPLSGIFAAGNNCMLKLSEFTPETSSLLAGLIGQYFDEEELVAINGGQEIAEGFAHLPFDHLLFTGSTSVGKKVMRAASENLVPVTLELGGKSPVIVGKNAKLAKVAESLVLGKSLNVGQVCLSPDYIFVKNDSLNELIAELEKAVSRYFPSLLSNCDYSSIINERHYQRLLAYISEARNAGGEIWEINPANENFAFQDGSFKIPPTLIINPEDSWKVMQEEIFGPVIPVKTYAHLDEVTEFINNRPRPLALYFFGSDKQQLEHLLNQTLSGGVTINDVIQHVSCEDLPFGGVGASGMGNYHGFDGFKTFSHTRSVYKQAGVNLMALAGLVPPYGEKATKILDSMIKK
ncbi:MAG: coniferyl aldehyde dehydrogenase [Pseudomonadales bacterium]|nr:coniferyl aldehyde dehydrogenase [Pseudomonadales bacterium]